MRQNYQLDWSAAEAANLLLNCLNHIHLFQDILDGNTDREAMQAGIFA
jgi:hypothetical protein